MNTNGPPSPDGLVNFGFRFLLLANTSTGR